MFTQIHNAVWLAALLKEDLDFEPQGVRFDGGIVGFGPESEDVETTSLVQFHVKENLLTYDGSRTTWKQSRLIEGIASILNLDLSTELKGEAA